MNDKETRALNGEMRAVLNADGKRMIVGYAAIFNSETELYPKYREKIDPAAFNEVLNDDVRALFNHDPNIVLGRTKSGTLKLSIDERGLKYEITPPDTAVAADLLKSIDRGDVSQSSFGFSIKRPGGDEVQHNKDGTSLRTIKRVKQLFDISPVTYPAYNDTAVALRSLEASRKNLHRNKLIETELEILSL
jgi:HK97 family phage prohead protease